MISLPAGSNPWQRVAEPLRQAWVARAPRERRAIRLAAWVLGLALLWSLALQPAWRTLRSAPPRIDALDAQLQAMQAQAADARELRATPPLPRAQASAALRAASERLGPGARLLEQGERVVITLDGVSGAQLRDWLAEVRASARARPVEANLSRSERGLSGTLVLALPAG